MKHIYILMIALFIGSTSYCQFSTLKKNVSLDTAQGKIEKPAVDESLIRQWPRFDAMNDVSICSNGLYFAYGIINKPLGSQNLIVQSVRKDWDKQFTSATCLFFSIDSKKFAFTRNDTLFLVLLGTNQVDYITNVESVQFPQGSPGEWIAYLQKDDSKTMVLLNLLTEKEVRFHSVRKFYFNKSGTGLIVVKDEGKRVLLQIVNLRNQKVYDVYRGESQSIESASLDNSGTQAIVTVLDSSSFSERGSNQNYSIWYYREGMDKAVLKVTNGTLGIESSLLIQPSARFSDDGRYIFFDLKTNVVRPVPIEGSVKVNIWNYKDPLIQSFQLGSPAQEPAYLCVFPAGIDTVARVIRLEKKCEVVYAFAENGDYVVVKKDNRDTLGDRFWLPYKCSFKLVCLKDGSSTLLNVSDSPESYFYFSPNGHFLVWFDAGKEQYFSYDLHLKQLVKISSNIPKGWLSYRDEFDKRYSNTFPVDLPAGWLPDDRGILVYDNFDIWLLDLLGKNPAINITEGYGRKHHIKFKVTDTKPNTVVTKDSLIMAAYNTLTKYNGFYQISLNKKGPPRLLTMGPYTYYHWLRIGLPDEFDSGIEPIKAAKSNSWIVSRQTFDQAPNYFFTTDFKSYQPLTDLQPHRGYNWLTAELVNFRQLDGSPGQGILYKPENFDPGKKYPLLVTYYRNFSGRLYECPMPLFMGSASLDIPWFVSRGYLVFTSDIYFTKYESGPSAYNSVVAAATYLSKMSFIDNKRMGITGHSFGGGHTNFLITHSNLFAAACEGAGVTDYVSNNLSLNGDGRARLSSTLNNANAFWTAPKLWIKNSPIFNVNKITTPLLMFHCRPDGAVPWGQAVELFLALRYLNKKVWLIEYDDGNHLVMGKNAEDFTARITQFFDHYLKGAPAPKWMTRGIPAVRKGLDSGLELDLESH
ncbi:S9 family peptidase [Niastella yeongjuensis]|nr:prolyl oligopeptidase family serine peptidase [Niastella yeongjuensis]